MIPALSGWQMNEITAPASEVIQITVQGKQNNITGYCSGQLITKIFIGRLLAAFYYLTLRKNYVYYRCFCTEISSSEA